MWETYLYKTLISFISLKAIIIFFKDNWLRLNPKRNGFLKRNFNASLPCLIPIFRWIWVICVLISSFIISSPDFVEWYEEIYNKRQRR